MLKIAVAGAGIGGLAFAAGAAQSGHNVTVFDQMHAPAPVGSGLVIQPVGQSVLASIGALEAANAMGAPISRMVGHETLRDRRVLDVSYDRTDGKAFGLAIHRAALFDALLNAASESGAIIRSSHQVVAADGKDLVFADGVRRGGFDLIVDATGARSPLSPIVARQLSFGAIWGTVDWPSGTPLHSNQLQQSYRRASNMVGVLPIGQVPGQSGQKAAIFWSLPADSFDDWKARGLAHWQDDATQLWPEFAPFAEQITDQAQMVMARYSHGTLRRPFQDTTVYIGDSAHRASPQLGQGANMALLDAWALVRALHKTHQNVSRALPLYAKSRRWHVRVYQGMSWAFTPQYQSHSKVLPWMRDHVLFPVSQVPPVPHILTRLVRGNLISPYAGLDATRV